MGFYSAEADIATFISDRMPDLEGEKLTG